jgi:hypothetical protein
MGYDKARERQDAITRRLNELPLPPWGQREKIIRQVATEFGCSRSCAWHAVPLSWRVSLRAAHRYGRDIGKMLKRLSLDARAAVSKQLAEHRRRSHKRRHATAPKGS